MRMLTEREEEILEEMKKLDEDSEEFKKLKEELKSYQTGMLD